MQRLPSVRSLSSAAFETVLVDHYAYSPPAIFFIAADYAPATLHLHIRVRAYNFGGKRDGQVHRGTEWNIDIAVEQHAIRRNVVALRVALATLRLDVNRQLDGKAV